MSAHICHARGCTRRVRPQYLMCADHWNVVPFKVKTAVYAHFRQGQCDDKRPSREWHEAASAAIGFVAMKTGLKFSVNEARAMVAYGVADARVRAGLAAVEAKKKGVAS